MYAIITTYNDIKKGWINHMPRARGTYEKVPANAKETMHEGVYATPDGEIYKIDSYGDKYIKTNRDAINVTAKGQCVNRQRLVCEAFHKDEYKDGSIAVIIDKTKPVTADNVRWEERQSMSSARAVRVIRKRHRDAEKDRYKKESLVYDYLSANHYDEGEREIAEMYVNDGLTLRQIAAKKGMSAPWIGTILRKIKERDKIPGTLPPKVEVKPEIDTKKLLSVEELQSRSGLTIREFAERYGYEYRKIQIWERGEHLGKGKGSSLPLPEDLKKLNDQVLSDEKNLRNPVTKPLDKSNTNLEKVISAVPEVLIVSKIGSRYYGIFANSREELLGCINGNDLYKDSNGIYEIVSVRKFLSDAIKNDADALAFINSSDDDIQYLTEKGQYLFDSRKRLLGKSIADANNIGVNLYMSLYANGWHYFIENDLQY